MTMLSRLRTPRLLAVAIAVACSQLGGTGAWAEVMVVSSGSESAHDQAGPAVTAPAVTVDVSPAKEAFTADEPITLVVRIANTSTKKIRVTNPDSRTFSMTMKDGSASYVAWPRSHSHANEVGIALEGGATQKCSTLLIEPGKTVEATCVIDPQAYKIVCYDGKGRELKGAAFHPVPGDLRINANLLVSTSGAGASHWSECASQAGATVRIAEAK